ncbi:Dabb family protein [Leeia oryzae]|uniref:Dabb family protein n=1 Tax=Leeia oryzae TaxID=356662 RepID=UPI00036829C1|nr:Dabb family protein [Leeia oryzae]
MLTHIVLFRFKPATTPEVVTALVQAFRDLKSQIPEVVSLESGTNNSPEKLDKGLTHGFVLTFANAHDRDVYLVHPIHQAFVAQVGPHVDDVLVFDFDH